MGSITTISIIGNVKAVVKSAEFMFAKTFFRYVEYCLCIPVLKGCINYIYNQALGFYGLKNGMFIDTFTKYADTHHYKELMVG